MTIRIALILTVVMLPLTKNLAQVTSTVNSANACSCDGTVTFNNPPLSVEYSLLDNNNSQISAGTAAAGNFSISGLCPGVFSLEVIQNSDTSIYYLNIPTSLVDPGDASFESICSTDGSVNLDNLVSGITPFGAWTSPSGNMLPLMPINAEFMEDGWYTYGVVSGACTVYTGVYIDFIQNADPGLTTTYEICETYVPFAMIDFMQGDPDPGGEWFDASGNPIDGFYYPATMNSGLFTYVIDTVPGCSPVFRTMNIDENAQPFAGNDTQISVCEGGIPFDMLTQLTGNPDAGGQWTSPQNTPVSGTFNPNTYTEGVYRYLITANAPCAADQALLTITFLDEDPSGESASISLCENASDIDMFLALNGNPTVGGNWTNISGQTVDGIFDPGGEIPGVYNYVFPNVGCSPDGADLTISVENLHNAGNDNSSITCVSASTLNLNSLLTLGAELGGIWTNEAGQQVSNSFAPSVGTGSYEFNYTVSGTLCPPDASIVVVTVQDAPEPPANNFIQMCEGDAPLNLSSLYPTIPDIFFENSGGVLIGELYNPSSGSQIITAVVASGNGCSDATGFIEIEVNNPVFADDSISIDLCSSLITFNLNTLLDAPAMASGSWFDQANQVVDEIIDLTAGVDLTYRYVIDPPPLCGSAELNVIVNVFEPQEAGEDNSFMFCSNDAPVALAELLPGSSSGVGTWSLNGLPYNNIQINPASDISGEYYYIVPQNGSCPSDFAILDITIQPEIDFSAGPDLSVCAGDPSVALGQTASPEATYSWTPSTDLSAANIPNPVLNIQADIDVLSVTFYTVTVNDGVCSFEDDIIVTISPRPIFQLVVPDSICRQDELTIAPGVEGNYSWSPAFLFDNPEASSQTIELQSSGNIICTVESDQGCMWSDTAGVIVNQLPFLQLFPMPLASCSPLEVIYAPDSSSSGIDAMIWQIDGQDIVTADTLNTILDTPGVYGLTATAVSAEGCNTSLNFESLLEVYPSPVADFSVTPGQLSTIDPIAQFSDNSTDAFTYQWNFAGLGISDEPNPIFEFPVEDPANFEVCLKVTSQLGCIDSTCRFINLDNQYVIYVPNAFTPDNDGLNDVFLPVLKGFDDSTYTFQIFDRWGELIFETHDVLTPWVGDVINGTHYAKDDVYHWQILIKDKEKAEYLKFRGLLTLIR